jgi:putative DNA primase/helicase
VDATPTPDPSPDNLTGAQAHALELWSSAVEREGEAGRERLRRYIEHVGVPVGLLPHGDVPRVLAYLREAPDGTTGDGRRRTAAAMVARLCNTDAGAAFRGSLLTYLEEGGPGARGGARPRLGTGTTRGKVCRLLDRDKPAELVIAAGVENGLACLTLLAGEASVWASIDAAALRHVAVPAAMIADPPEVADDQRGKGTLSMLRIVVGAGEDDAAAAYELQERLGRQYGSQLRVFVLRASVGLLDAEISAALAARLGVGLDKLGSRAFGWHDLLAVQAPAVVRYLVDGGAANEVAVRFRATPPGTRAGSAPEGGKGADTAPPLRPVPIIEDGPLSRARRFLVDRCTLRDSEGKPRSGTVFTLRYWQDCWWTYCGTHWKLIAGVDLRGRVWHWLDGFWSVGRDGPIELEPTRRMVEDVVEALATYVLVDAQTMPVWLEPDYGADGAPRWTTERRLGSGSGLPEPGMLIASRGGLLDVQEWIAGRVVEHPHTPRLFSRACLPYALPADKMRAAVADGTEHELVAAQAGVWLKFLGEAFEDDEQSIKALQQWFGYNLIPDTSLEKILMVQGLKRSGKGTVITGLVAMQGKDAIVMTSMSKLTGRFGLASFPGKLSAIMGDAHIGRFTDATEAVEILKGGSGGDAQAIDRKNKDELPYVMLNVRYTIACNRVPDLPDASNALAGRLILLRMFKSFYGREDKSLKKRVAAEAQGIGIWGLIGLRELWAMPAERREIEQPIVANEMLADLRRQSAGVEAFVEDCCLVGPSHTVAIKDLHATYVRWCEENGKHPLAVDRFGLDLRLVGTDIRVTQPRDVKGGRQRLYVGIGLRSNVDLPFGTDVPV